MSSDDFADAVERERRKTLARIEAVPISVLVWGPAPTATSPVAKTRLALRKALESDGHLVHYSEELYDAGSPHSVLAQQVADVEAHDLTLSIPDSPGSIAEIHDFARIPSVSHRIVTFIDENHNNGYANKTLLQLQSTITCRVRLYNPIDLPACVIDASRQLTRSLQEFYYLAGRR